MFSMTQIIPPRVKTDDLVLALVPPYRVTPERFDALIESGHFAPESKIELIDGWVIEKPMKNAPHEITSNKVNRWLHRVLPDGWFVSIEKSFDAQSNLVIPDAMLVRGDPGDYQNRRPSAHDVGLIIEIADSSLAYDQGIKTGLYLNAGVQRYWISNIQERVIEVYTLVIDGAEFGRLTVADLFA